MSDSVKIGDLLAGVEVEDNGVEEDQVILDAFVIYRVQRPDQKHPSIFFTSTASLDDEDEIGMLTIVLDRKREKVKDNWVEGD